MAAKYVVICFSALFVQTITGQCLGFNAGNNIGVNNMGCGCGQGLGDYGLDRSDFSGAAGLAGLTKSAISNAGAFGTSSSSPLVPKGMSVLADRLQLEGILTAAGDMPFLTTVGLNGALPTSGSAGVSYSAGNGNVGILRESAGFGAGYGASDNAAVLGFGASGYGAGAAGLGIGAGAGIDQIGYGAGPAVGYGNRLGLNSASLTGCACNARY